jgi:hypothetical protein
MTDRPEPTLESRPQTAYTRPPEYRNSRAITITFIVSCTVIVLACITGMVVVAAAFFLNAPW